MDKIIGVTGSKNVCPGYKNCPHYTEVCFASFLSVGFTTITVINPPERKLAERTSVHCSDSTGQKSGQSHLYALKWSKKDFTLLHIYFSNLLSEPNKLLLKMILNLITLLKHLFSKKYAHILLSPLPILAKDVKYIELRPIFQHRSKLYISCFEYAQS